MKMSQQVTPAEMRAPKGRFRIVCEHMGDGELEIIVDLYNETLAKSVVASLQEESDIYTLWNDRGKEVSP